MADMKYEDATPVDEPVAKAKQKAKQKAKPTPPKEMSFNAMYKKSEGFKPNDSEELKSSPVAGLDLTEPNPYNDFNSGPSSYAKGGSASSRADGCAQRGKTKGMMR